MMPAIPDRTAFIVSNTTLRPVPLTPEIVLHLADEAVPLWQKTEEELATMGLPPPFWAFAWAGGQALARYVIDHPRSVMGKRVLDLASGSGLVAIAAAKAGAAHCIAADIDRFAECAIAVNARANNVVVEIMTVDLLAEDSSPPQVDVVLVGDLFYERTTAERTLAFLDRRAAAGAEIFIGDPGRSYLPTERLNKLADYSVPVTRDLEDQAIKRTGVFALKTA